MSTPLTAIRGPGSLGIARVTARGITILIVGVGPVVGVRDWLSLLPDDHIGISTAGVAASITHVGALGAVGSVGAHPGLAVLSWIFVVHIVALRVVVPVAVAVAIASPGRATRLRTLLMIKVTSPVLATGPLAIVSLPATRAPALVPLDPGVAVLVTVLPILVVPAVL